MNLEETFREIDNLFLKKKGKHLNQAEKIVLQAAWEDRGYKEVASSHSQTYLQRHVGPGLWNFLSQTYGEPITKKKLRRFFEQKTASPCQSEEQAVDAESTRSVLGGQPPDPSTFYGYVEELAALERAVTETHCVTLTGAPGIGKSTLAAKLIRELCQKADSSGFDCYIWKSIHYSWSLGELIDDLTQLLDTSPVPEAEVAKNPQAKVSAFIEHLRGQRCLFVLDAAEVLLQRRGSSRLRGYGEKYADYSVLFRRIVEEQHQSCLILTSREPFIDVIRLQRFGRLACAMKLEGLGQEAAHILQAKGLTGREKWGELIQTYRGNPLALKIVASTIRDFFGGSVEMFCQCNTILTSELFQELLDQQFERLTALERQILLYLGEALDSHEGGSIPLMTLLNNLKSASKRAVSTSELIDALEALSARSLIETRKAASGEALFALQPVIQKYVLADPLGILGESAEVASLGG